MLNLVVDWKLVRKKVRHKFDKLSNCKVAVDVATKEFPFSLVGIAGNDIVDGNQNIFVHYYGK